MRMVMFQKTTGGPRLPHEVKNRRNVFESAQAIAPGARRFLRQPRAAFSLDSPATSGSSMAEDIAFLFSVFNTAAMGKTGDRGPKTLAAGLAAPTGVVSTWLRCVFESHCCFATVRGAGRFNKTGIANQGKPRRTSPAKVSSLSLFYKVAGGASYGLKPAFSMPRWASGFFMNVSQTNPERAFSAMSMVMPVSMPMTSVSYQSVSGLNASTKP